MSLAHAVPPASPSDPLSTGLSPCYSTPQRHPCRLPLNAKWREVFKQSEEPIYKSSYPSVVIYAPPQLLQQTALVGCVLFLWCSFSSRNQYLPTKLHSFNFPCESVDCRSSKQQHFYIVHEHFITHLLGTDGKVASEPQALKSSREFSSYKEFIFCWNLP